LDQETLDEISDSGRRRESMARLYADEDFPFPVVEKLRQLGHDVLTTPEAVEPVRRTRINSPSRLPTAERS